MSNVPFSITVPASVGVGVGVDVSSSDASLRQYQYNGAAGDQVRIEGSRDNVNWSPIVHSDGSQVVFNGASPDMQQTNDRSLYVRARRILGSGSATCSMTGAQGSATGLGDQNPTPLTLLQRTAAGAGLVTAIILGAVGAIVSPSGDIRVTSAAHNVLCSVDVATGLVANPLIAMDGADGIQIAPIGRIGIGDDTTARVVQVGNGETGSRVTIVGGVGTSTWSLVAGAVLNIGTDGNDHDIAIGSGSGGGLITVRAGTEGATIATTGIGPLILTGGSGATNAFAVGSGGTLTLGNVGSACTINVGGTGAIKTIKIGDEAVFVNVVSIAGSASRLGFFGATPIVQPGAYTISWAGGGSRTLANTTLTVTGIDNLQAGTVYASAADLTNAMTQITSLSNVLKTFLGTDVKGLGLTA